MTLRARPAGVKYKFGAGEARVKVGSLEQTVAVTEGQGVITFSVELPEGPALMQTWISEADQDARGAYYVEVEKGSE